jgi:hemolysin III
MAVVSPSAPPGGPAPRPKLRGALHLAALPVSLVAGLVLVVTVADGPGVVYALRRPDPVPDVYGYHEVFHTCTLVGFATHYIAVALAGS